MSTTEHQTSTETPRASTETPRNASANRVELLRDLLGHASMAKKNARQLQPGDRILKVGDTWHDVKRITVTRVQLNVLGYVMVYGTTATSAAETLIFRGLAPTVKVVTVDAEAVAR